MTHEFAASIATDRGDKGAKTRGLSAAVLVARIMLIAGRSTRPDERQIMQRTHDVHLEEQRRRLAKRKAGGGRS
jgi:hypothetical protein